MCIIFLLLLAWALAFGPPEVIGNCERAAVVFLHGKNEDNRDPFNRVAPFNWLATELDLCFVLPAAPEQLDASSGRMMSMWYRTPTRERTPQALPHFNESFAHVLSLLHEHLSHPHRRVYVGGFSQGGALALALATTPALPRALSGAFVLSGYEVVTGAVVVPALQPSWLLFVHHKRDFIVPFAHAMAAYAHALEQGVNAAFVLGADAHPEHHFTASSILLIQRALATPPVLPPARTVVDWSWYEQEEQPQFRVDL